MSNKTNVYFGSDRKEVKLKQTKLRLECEEAKLRLEKMRVDKQEARLKVIKLVLEIPLITTALIVGIDKILSL